MSDRADIDLEGLLHQPAFLAFDALGAGVHGQIHSVAQGETGRRLPHYHLVLVPRLAYLAHAHQQRMFQNMNVPTIIAAVLEGDGSQLSKRALERHRHDYRLIRESEY